MTVAGTVGGTLENPALASDLQSQFEARAVRSDFLTAGKVEDVVGLCLSGGGYRAMLYHTGALFRLNELGILPRLREMASVSGGSIAATALALVWRGLHFDADGRAGDLGEAFVVPVMRFARIGVDVRAILVGMGLVTNTPTADVGGLSALCDETFETA